MPYVLLVIAVLSVSLMLMAQRMQKTSKLMAEIESQFTGNIALNSAEAEAIYALMVSVPAQNGYELNPEEGVTVFEVSKERETPIDLWSARGGVRQSITPAGAVIIRHRDGSGFVPINSANKEAILALTRSFGISTKKQESLTAKLLDYMDEDTHRQFRGGERADYRLRQMSPPSNASLRKIGELNDVLEWNTLLDELGYREISDRVTLNTRVKTVKKNFIEPSLLNQLGMDFATRGDIYDTLKLDNYPTDVARFTFYFRSTDGKIMRRKTEVDKTISFLDKPFSRQLLYQDSIPNPDPDSALDKFLSTIEGRKHVIHAETYRYK